MMGEGKEGRREGCKRGGRPQGEVGREVVERNGSSEGEGRGELTICLRAYPRGARWVYALNLSQEETAPGKTLRKP